MTVDRFFVGVDGGGTKTEFLCIDDGGAVRARARTGTTYHPQVGLEGVARALTDGIGALCAQAGIVSTDMAFAFIGLPAFGEDSAIDPLLGKLCGQILGHDRYRCGNDMICGWAGSLGCGDGINLVAGTGSIGYGRRGDREARVGGWGEMFSDEGSAYWIATQGLNAFTRMSDGRLPRGPLHHAVRERLALDSDLDLCARMLGDGSMGRDAVAALAPLVVQASIDGDEAATTILARAASELAEMAIALRASLGYAPGERTRISWSGGVLSKAGPVRDGFRDILRGGDLFDIVEPRWDPAEGAARYARLLADASPDTGIGRPVAAATALTAQERE